MGTESSSGGRKPPAEVMRALRQRCGFGCAMCGSPVFDYEHIDGFAVTGHDVDRMTLLCPAHHREKTAGRIDPEAVRRANDRPFNRSASFTAAHRLYFDGHRATVGFGNGQFEAVAVSGGDRAAALIVDGAVVFGVRITAGHLRLTLQLRDEDNHTLLRIDDGWLKFSVRNWDVQVVGPRVVINGARGDVMLALKLNPPTSIEIERAHTYFNHVPILVGKDAPHGGLEVAGAVLAGLTIQDGSVFVNTPRQGYPAGIEASDGPRHYGAPPAPLGGSFSRTTRGHLRLAAPTLG